MGNEELREIIAYYREQGAPQDQQMLIALLREAQESDAGVLSQSALSVIAQVCGIKETMLQALIRRVPGLRFEAAPHRLEICGSCKAGVKLRDYIEQMYEIRSGGVSEAGKFAYRVTPCMKNCKNGPSIRWDGSLYGHADEKLIRSLIEGNNMQK